MISAEESTIRADMVAAIRADIVALETRIDELVDILDWRRGSSVSRAIDYLRIAAHHLDYVPNAHIATD